MKRRVLALATVLALAGSLMGVALAHDGGSGTDDASVAATSDDSGTSTTLEGSTSTTFEDDDESHGSGPVADQTNTYDIPAVGTVTVEVRVTFRGGSSEVEFEAELEHEVVKIERHQS